VTEDEDESHERRLAAPVSPERPLTIIREELDRGRTRLIVRGRVSHRWPGSIRERSRPPGRLILIERVYEMLAHTSRTLMLAAASVGHYIMQSRMLRGIKRRAEA
jgi:hypothetical protein